jgi:hypothetical protein
MWAPRIEQVETWFGSVALSLERSLSPVLKSGGERGYSRRHGARKRLGSLDLSLRKLHFECRTRRATTHSETVWAPFREANDGNARGDHVLPVNRPHLPADIAAEIVQGFTSEHVQPL